MTKCKFIIFYLCYNINVFLIIDICYVFYYSYLIYFNKKKLSIRLFNVYIIKIDRSCDEMLYVIFY